MDFNPTDSNIIVEQQLNSQLNKIHEIMKADVLTFKGPLVSGTEDLVRDALEKIENKKKKLVVIVETYGGYIHVVQRIVNVFRYHYKLVDFIVPNYAMSAGTILVMSGDAIYMDYFSVLGPIDPQVEGTGERKGMIPALNYLAKYEELMEKANKGGLTTEELSYLIAKFDPAEIESYKQARDLSIELLKDWLAKYKFKNWKRTESRGEKVTARLKKERAKEIAEKLNETKEWLSHSRGITINELIKKLNLKIENFGDNKILNDALKTYHKLLCNFMHVRSQQAVIHSKDNYLCFM